MTELTARLNTSVTDGDVIVVSGPAGCGKSGLLAAAPELLQDPKKRVVFAAAGGPADAPSVDITGPAGELVESVTGDRPAPDADGLAEQLVQLAGSTPLLLVVDDVHTADPESRKVLQRLAQRIKSAPITVLLSVARRSSIWSLQGLSSLFPKQRYIVTAPLTRAGVADLGQHRAGTRLAATVVDELMAVAGGNIALTQAILDDMVAAGVTDAPVFGPSFAQTIHGWMHRIRCAPLAEVVQAIAVLGASCTSGLLNYLVEVQPHVTRRICDELRSSGVLSDEVTLHPRVSGVLLAAEDGGLSELQLRAPQLLYDDGAPAEEVARQLVMNGSAAQPWAVDILCEAAHHAARSKRHQDAVALLQFASRWCVDENARAEVDAALVDFSWWLKPLAASRRLGALLESARQGRLPSRSVLRMARRLAWLGSADEANEMLRLAREDPDGDADADARIELAISEFWINHLFPGSAQPLPAASGALPPESFAGSYPWLSSAQRLSSLLVAERQQDVQLLAEEILQQCQPDHSNLEAVQMALFFLLAAERQDSVRTWLAKRPARQTGSAAPPQWRSMVCVTEAVDSWWQGDLSDAMRAVRRALEVLDVQQWGGLVGLPRGVLLLVMTEQGRHQEVAEELLRSMPVSFTRSPYGLVYLRARGLHHLATGSLQAALADFHNCRDILTSWGMELPGLVPWRLDLARALLSLGEHKEAQLLAKEHLGLSPDAFSSGRGTALHLLSVASPLSGRAAGLRDAVRVLERSGNVVELARALGSLAQTYRQTGQLAYARTTLSRAKMLARRCGAQWALREISSTASSGGALTDPQPHVQHPDLSAAEMRVAELAAQGYTNREIAGALFVTTSTVEQHLTHIYKKLKVRERSEVGALIRVS
ncbi:hypothetical protein AN218_33400 [Streptomyces nanshensis]|uniref:HTH luxR-type domain-containing protein n=1 Tax=Streptomyces nanshensis TaxID=518642 RepID=A0A1E7KER4_9ACTN|nr:hypothetical protein AN218_33400 [Streptomyces nanshensis]